MTNGKWELKGHSYQIADTGDYDGHWEITNGKMSLFSKDDDEEVLQPVVDALNESGCKFYLDDADKVEIQLLKYQVEDLKKALDKAREDERKQKFIVAEVREYLDLLLREDITFGRFVELLNERPGIKSGEKKMSKEAEIACAISADSISHMIWKEQIITAHMKGQRNAGIDPSYHAAFEYYLSLTTPKGE